MDCKNDEIVISGECFAIGTYATKRQETIGASYSSPFNNGWHCSVISRMPSFEWFGLEPKIIKDLIIRVYC